MYSTQVLVGKRDAQHGKGSARGGGGGLPALFPLVTGTSSTKKREPRMESSELPALVFV